MATQEDPQTPESGPRSRLEDEVLEILYRAEKQPASFTDHVRRKTQEQRRQPVQQAADTAPQLASLTASPSAMLIGAFVAAFLAILVRDASALLANLLAFASVALLLGPIVMRYRRPDSGDIKRWRGRDIDMSSDQPPWAQDLRDRFRKPPHR